VMTGLGTKKREVLVSTVIDAEPLYRQLNPGPSIWPLVSGVAVSAMFVGSIFTPWAIVWGAIPIAIGLIAWFWPSRPRASSGPLRVRA